MCTIGQICNRCTSSVAIATYITRSRNVSEYMLVLALCLVVLVNDFNVYQRLSRLLSHHTVVWGILSLLCLLSPPYGTGQAIIFLPCGFFLCSFYLFCSLNLSRRRLDVYHWRFLRPAFLTSHVQHVSDLHPEFALRPHHV